MWQKPRDVIKKNNKQMKDFVSQIDETQEMQTNRNEKMKYVRINMIHYYKRI